jgi:hypothetical protein
MRWWIDGHYGLVAQARGLPAPDTACAPAREIASAPKWGGRPRPRATPWSRFFDHCQVSSGTAR